MRVQLPIPQEAVDCQELEELNGLNLWEYLGEILSVEVILLIEAKNLEWSEAMLGDSVKDKVEHGIFKN